MLPETLPPLEVTPGTGHIFMFSAITWNRHHIHYDKDAALAEGHTGVVVQRALLGNYLARLVTQWLSDQGELRTLSWRVQKSALPDKPLTCQGEVVGREGHTWKCELRILDQTGAVVAAGEAQVFVK